MRIAVISPINTPDGISRYSRSLYSALPSDFKVSFLANRDISSVSERDDSSVYRLWINKNKNFDAVFTWLDEHKPDLVHIQLHPEYMPPECLDELLAGLSDKKIIVTMHSFGGWYAQYAELLNQAHIHKVIIHKKDNEAASVINAQKLEIIPLGYNSYPKLNKQEFRQALNIEHSPVIVTHGLITPSKGLLETAIAIKELKQTYPDILWLAANAVNSNNPSSQTTLNDLESYIEMYDLQSNVRLVTNFLTDTQASSIIQVADIGLFAYKEVGEGASDAIRKFISCGIPTIVTDIPVMQEFSDEVFKIADTQPNSIAAGVKLLWEDKDLQAKVSKSASDTAQKLSWDRIALKLVNIYKS